MTLLKHAKNIDRDKNVIVGVPTTVDQWVLSDGYNLTNINLTD